MVAKPEKSSSPTKLWKEATKCLVSAIEPAIKEATAKQVQEALVGKKMLPSNLAAGVVTAWIVSMEYSSNEDPEPHATVELIDATGRKVATGPVPNNLAKQQLRV